MSYFTLRVARPLYSRVSLARLVLILKYVRVFELCVLAGILVCAGLLIGQFLNGQFSAGRHATVASAIVLTDETPSDATASSLTVTTDPGGTQQMYSSTPPVSTTPPLPTGPTSEEIQAALDQWSQKYPSLNLSATLLEIGGQSRRADLLGSNPMTSASIYKLYLSVYLYREIEAGRLTLDTIGPTGKTTRQCIESMLVRSDNICAEAIGSQVGWSKLHNYVKSLGLKSTVLNVAPLRTSSDDSALFLQKLYAGELITSEHNVQIMEYLVRQIQRKGIAAGMPTATVYDRVGYGSGVWNDAAIVRSSTGPVFILTVFTSSNNPDAIRNLAASLQTLLGG